MRLLTRSFGLVIKEVINKIIWTSHEGVINKIIWTSHEGGY